MQKSIIALSGLQEYTGKQMKSRASSPRLMVHDTSLMTAGVKLSAPHPAMVF